VSKLDEDLPPGKKVRCRQCDAVYRVPDDDGEPERAVTGRRPARAVDADDDDRETRRPRRRRRRREESGTPVGLIVGIAVAVVVVLSVAVIAGVYVMKHGKETVVAQADGQPPPQFQPPDNQLPPGGGRGDPGAGGDIGGRRGGGRRFGPGEEPTFPGRGGRGGAGPDQPPDQPPGGGRGAGGNPPANAGQVGTEEGMTAKEIEGEDIDGQRFKLSDYRGKVVLLDFWGHW
jgi:hypothetical protein